jgi:hypothetical protein
MKAIALVLIGLIATTAVGCQSRDPAADVRSLEADFSAVEQLHVIGFAHFDDCGDYLDYPRGTFVTDLQRCFEGYPSADSRLVFDAQAKADLSALLSATEAHGPRLQSADVLYQPGGGVGPGSAFGFSEGLYYVYKPSDERKAGFVDSTCAEQVNADWYKTWQC